jgi:hypothetical protein
MKSLGRFAAAGESPTPVTGASPTSRPMKAAAKKERTKAKSKSTRLRDSYTWRHKEEKNCIKTWANATSTTEPAKAATTTNNNNKNKTFHQNKPECKTFTNAISKRQMQNKLTPLHLALQTNNDIGVQTLPTQHLRNQVCRRKDEEQQWQWLERERERACIPKEIKYVEEKTKGTGDGAWARERASESKQTYRKQSTQKKRTKGTGDGERAGQQRREKRLRKERFSKRARKPVEMDVFWGTCSCICTSAFIQIRYPFRFLSSFCWPCLLTTKARRILLCLDSLVGAHDLRPL